MEATVQRRGAWRPGSLALILLLVLAGPTHVPSTSGDEPEAPRTLEGAKKLTEGAFPCLSPDGASLAFVRWKTDRRHVDYRGDPIPIPQLYVRTLARKSDAKRKLEAIPLGWAGNGSIALHLGWAVDAKSGRRAKDLAALPDGLEVRRLAWSRDGSRLVYVPDEMFYEMNPSVKSPAPVGKGLFLVGASGDVRELDLGHLVKTDSCTILSWSPDGKHVAFDMTFFRDGNLPVRRVGVVDADSGAVQLVAMSEWSPREGEAWFLDGGCDCGVKGEGGIRENTPGVSRRGSPSCSCGAKDCWDAEGKRFAFVAMGAEGAWDAHVASADGKDVHRLTDDGGLKWSACLDPAGQRIAWWQGTAPSPRAPPATCEIRIRHLYSDELLRVPAPRDAGVGSGLVWARDGSSLYFECVGADGPTLWQQRVPEAPQVADGAEIREAG